jgi:hypothetical protein
LMKFVTLREQRQKSVHLPLRGRPLQ